MFNSVSSAYISARRSVEDPAFGMKVFGISGALNIALNWLLIFGKCGFPALGVTGAAIATLISRITEVVFCLVSALRCKRLPFEADAFFHPNADILRQFIRYSAPVVFNEALWGLGASLTTVILGHTVNSAEMLAAYAVIGNLNRLLQVMCFALGMATAVVLGKAIGEGKRHSTVMSLTQALLAFATLVGLVIGILSLLLMPTLFIPVIFPLFKLLGETGRIAAILAITYFAVIPARSYLFTALIGVLRAGGDVNSAVAIDLLPLWLLGLPLTALVALTLQMGPWPIALIMLVEDLSKVPLCAIRIRSGKWIHDVTKQSG